MNLKTRLINLLCFNETKLIIPIRQHCVNRIKSKLQHKILHCIYVKGKNSKALKTIYFDYARNNRTKLSLITERSGNPDLIPNYVWHPHGFYFLTWYNIPENLTGGLRT